MAKKVWSEEERKRAAMMVWARSGSKFHAAGGQIQGSKIQDAWMEMVMNPRSPGNALGREVELQLELMEARELLGVDPESLTRTEWVAWFNRKADWPSRNAEKV